MSPRWRVFITYDDGRGWKSYSSSEKGARDLYEALTPEGMSVLLVRRSDDRKGYVEVERKDSPARAVRLAE